jgi:formylmethanofuran dehydrogenase subunit C
MPLQLVLHTQPSVPLEAEALSCARIDGMNAAQVLALGVLHGNEPATIGDFFRASGEPDGELRLEGDLSRVKYIGAGMRSGRLLIDGHAGAHLGSGMTGGEIIVTGDAGDWVAPEMTGGRIIIRGNAGHLAGSAHRGSHIGMRGGEIIVLGNVRNETGNGMRGGLIAVGGNAGDFTGVNMLAGTIVVLGEPGIRTGAGMKRGTIVSGRDIEILPTFFYACTYHPAFLRMYLLYLRELGLPVSDGHIDGRYRRYSGDGVELKRGEILVFAGH